MGTKIFLLRNGDTPWHRQGRLLGRRDIGLSPEGLEQVRRTQDLVSTVPFSELICSPLASAIETAEVFVTTGLSIGRDQRLNNADLGPWEGASISEIAKADAFTRLFAGEGSHIPDVEDLEAIRHRVVSSIEQALDDNPPESHIIMVSHSVPIRIALTHYLDIPANLYPRFRLAPASFCVLQREEGQDTTRVLAMNWPPPVDLLLASPKSL